ncbi:MAG: DUF975 family protein [Clostridia bacterium]|nr:DUF975 family protein [Clostridia bacterium]
MMNSKALRQRAWCSLKGKYWLAFLTTVIVSLICSVGAFFLTYSNKMIGITDAVPADELDATLKAGAIMIAAMSFAVSIIGTVLTTFISNPMSIGNNKYFIDNTTGKPKLSTIFYGFKTKYMRNVGVLLLAEIKLMLWSLLFIIPGIIKAFEYAIIPYILADDSSISSKDAFKKAKEMMRGNKWRLFKLNFSFIGWVLLCIPTVGLGALFLVPYVEAANAEFYMELKSK